MTDQNSFMETVKAVAEIVRISEAPLSRSEMLSYFSDMNLSEEQENIVLQYLTSPPEEHDVPENAEGHMVSENSTEHEISEDEIEQTEEKPAILKVYMDELADLPVYTQKERREMYQALLSGDDKEISSIVEMWLSKVTQIAQKYEQPKISLEDLIQEGNMALFLKLTELCGTGEQAQIEQELNNAIETGIMQFASRLAGENELESAMRGKVSLVYEASQFLKKETGHEPSLEEIADYTKLQEDELNDIMDMIYKILGE